MRPILLALFLISGCDSPETKVVSEDYVLIEFAARLEEDYHKIEKTK